MSDPQTPVLLGVRRSRWVDHAGAAGSLVCAFHCALLPILAAALPAFGLMHWLSHDFEAIWVAFASLLGMFSLIWSYRRHRRFSALSLLLPGIVILWLGVLYEPLHHDPVPHAVVMTLGGTLVGLGHLINLRLNHTHVHDATCEHEADAP